MSCGQDNLSSTSDGDCIVSTLLSVAEAQEIVEEDCRSGCQQAIDELKGRSKPKSFDTIPVLLTVNGNPFFGVGALRNNCSDNLFDITKSFLFRVNDVDEETRCAALELLKPVSHHHEKGEEGKKNRGRHETGFDQFLEELSNAKKIDRTGICVTVDLEDVTSVSCMPPIYTV